MKFFYVAVAACLLLGCTKDNNQLSTLATLYSESPNMQVAYPVASGTYYGNQITLAHTIFSDSCMILSNNGGLSVLILWRVDSLRTGTYTLTGTRNQVTLWNDTTRQTIGILAGGSMTVTVIESDSLGFTGFFSGTLLNPQTYQEEQVSGSFGHLQLIWQYE